jgi:hypothetical protein
MSLRRILALAVQRSLSLMVALESHQRHEGVTLISLQPLQGSPLGQWATFKKTSALSGSHRLRLIINQWSMFSCVLQPTNCLPATGRRIWIDL